MSRALSFPNILLAIKNHPQQDYIYIYIYIYICTLTFTFSYGGILCYESNNLRRDEEELICCIYGPPRMGMLFCETLREVDVIYSIFYFIMSTFVKSLKPYLFWHKHFFKNILLIFGHSGWLKILVKLK